MCSTTTRAMARPMLLSMQEPSCDLSRIRAKESVVRRMFADVEADIYVMINGDATYDAASVREMVAKTAGRKPGYGERRPQV